MDQSTDWHVPDGLSETARQVLAVEPNAYARLTPTGDGSAGAKALLDGLRAEQLLTAPVRSPDDAHCLLAGLWLYHDWLDESHAISQAVASPTGSFWHAVMHRREGDFSNAKYWYARCRRHPALAQVAAEGRGALEALPERKVLGRLVTNDWDPDGFVDVVEAVHHKPDDPLYEAAVRLQRAEWRVLFAHCVQAATKAKSGTL